MGLFSGNGGLTNAFQSVAATVANLAGQSVSMLKLTLTQSAGLDGLAFANNGARLHFGAGASDFASSDGTTVTFACPVTINGSTTLTNSAFRLQSSTLGFSVLGASSTAPTVVAGAGAALVANNGTMCFEVNLGGAAQTGTITFPSATTGWVVSMYNITNPAANAPAQTGFTQTTATFTNFIRTTGVAGNWTANDHMVCIAMAY